MAKVCGQQRRPGQKSGSKDTSAGEQTCARCVCMTPCSQNNFTSQNSIFEKMMPKQRRDEINEKRDSKVVKVPKTLPKKW